MRSPPPPLLRLCAEEGRVEAGVDEAGRGSLAGPVVAGAVVWNPEVCDPEVHPELRLVRDSKRLTPSQRERARAFVERHALGYSVCFVDNGEIDRVNILRATHKAMHGALDGLPPAVVPEFLLVDGDRFPVYMSPRTGDFVPHTCVVEGDNAFVSIAAASILAKTHRDRYMREVLHPSHPGFGWDRNMGYGARVHMDALMTLGPTAWHRKTFAPVRRAATAAVNARI